MLGQALWVVALRDSLWLKESIQEGATRGNFKGTLRLGTVEEPANGKDTYEHIVMNTKRTTLEKRLGVKKYWGALTAD